MELNQAQIEALKQIGSEWKNYGKHRIYFNDLHEFYGLEVWYYNSGNISGAKRDGEGISNNQAKKIMGRLEDSKVWFDFADSEFHVKRDRRWGMTDEEKDAILSSIQAKMNEMALEVA